MSSLCASPEQLAAARLAIAYCLRSWDWESPILFGAERQVVESVLGTLPYSLLSLDPLALRVVCSALNEMLNGPAALESGAVQEILAVEQASARMLLAAVSSASESASS